MQGELILMIRNYSAFAVYEVYQQNRDGKTRKIGIIENSIWSDVDRNGRKTNTRFEFSNTDLFWRPIGPVKIKKIDRPLKGSEPVVWGIYWTLHVLGTIIAVVAEIGRAHV